MQLNNTPDLPRISIVTPSYNQGRYLESAIISVIGQRYPNLEYIVLDGGSTDNSVELIKKYESHIAHWESRPDRGQADAINRGFSMATGDIFAWLNSDDMHLPNTLNYVARQFTLLDDMDILFGNCLHFNQEAKSAAGSDVEGYHRRYDIELCDYIIQPSCFWKRSIWNAVGELKANLEYGLDWDWFIRANRCGARFRAFGEFLSIYRIHPQYKTGIGGLKRIQELAGIYRAHHSEQIASSYFRLKTNATIRRLNSLMTRARVQKFLDPKKIVHRLFFRHISYRQFEQISLMWGSYTDDK